MHRHTKAIIIFAVGIVAMIVCTALYQAYTKAKRAHDACLPGVVDDGVVHDFVLNGREYVICDVDGGVETRRAEQ